MLSKCTLPTLLLAAMLALTPALAAAQAAAPAVADDQTEIALGSGDVGTDTALGTLAAIGCGFMIRATIYTAGTQVGTIAGAIATCGYALFDAFVIEGHHR